MLTEFSYFKHGCHVMFGHSSVIMKFDMQLVCGFRNITRQTIFLLLIQLQPLLKLQPLTFTYHCFSSQAMFSTHMIQKLFWPFFCQAFSKCNEIWYLFSKWWDSTPVQFYAKWHFLKLVSTMFLNSLKIINGIF